jgi:hypothetical protein
MGASDPISLTLEWEGVDGSPLPPDAKIVDDGLGQLNQCAADFTTSLKCLHSSAQRGDSGWRRVGSLVG